MNPETAEYINRIERNQTLRLINILFDKPDSINALPIIREFVNQIIDENTKLQDELNQIKPIHDKEVNNLQNKISHLESQLLVLINRINSTSQISENLFYTMERLAFDFGTRTLNILEKHFEYIGELVQQDKRDLLKIEGIGKNTIKDIELVLKNLGLSLGMKIENWDILLDMYLGKLNNGVL